MVFRHADHYTTEDLVILQLLRLPNNLSNMWQIYFPSMGGSPGELSEELVTQEKRKKGWRMICDVGEAT